MKRKLPWLSKEERRRMEIIRGDVERQLQRTRDIHRAAELEKQLFTLTRELSYDK
jgi:hypothetical protein